MIVGGKVLHRKGYGLAILEHRVPVTPRTVLRLASVSKQFTAMAVMILAERGRLSYADDVRKHIPELPAVDPKRPIRIHDLLHHTSGIPDYTNMMEELGRPIHRVRNEDVVKLLAGKKYRFPPGSRSSGSRDSPSISGLSGTPSISSTVGIRSMDWTTVSSTRPAGTVGG